MHVTSGATTDAGAGLMLAIVAVSDYTITFVNTLSNTVTVSLLLTASQCIHVHRLQTPKACIPHRHTH
jgi:hypothetical protein